MHHADWWFIDFAGAEDQFAAEQAAYRAVHRSAEKAVAPAKKQLALQRPNN